MMASSSALRGMRGAVFRNVRGSAFGLVALQPALELVVRDARTRVLIPTIGLGSSRVGRPLSVRRTLAGVGDFRARVAAMLFAWRLSHVQQLPRAVRRKRQVRASTNVIRRIRRGCAAAIEAGHALDGVSGRGAGGQRPRASGNSRDTPARWSGTGRRAWAGPTLCAQR